jgi:hypothetical protein
MEEKESVFIFKMTKIPVDWKPKKSMNITKLVKFNELK